jgi:uncharacterized membrane protein YebE (DUF533 family)
MFDPKVLLDALVAGTAHRPQEGHDSAAGSGGLADILEQISRAAHTKQQQQEIAQAAGGGQMTGDSGAFGDILKKLGPNAQQGGGGEPSFDLGEFLRKLTAGAGTQSQPNAGPSAGGLGELMGQIFGKLSQGAPSTGEPSATGTGALGQVLGQILGQATAGVREGGGRINEATGASDKLDEMIRQATGQSAPELVAKIKDFIAQNQLAAGAAAGGLGTILLGTKTGRSLALGAAKLGGLALIGGLAYKAYQNHTQGKPVPGANALLAPTAAPSGSGFEPEVQTPDHALLYIRTMISAAAADGEIDEVEQEKIFSSLKQLGMATHAVEFLQKEVQDPLTVEDLVRASDTPKTALEVYTAARVAVEPHSEKEQQFLRQLRDGLKIDPKLAAQVDAQASGLKS